MYKHNVYRNLLLWPSGNIGDSIVTSGLIRHFAESASKVYLPLKKNNESNSLINTISYILHDLPNVEIIEHVDTNNYDELASSYDNATRIYAASIFSFKLNGWTCCPMWDEQWYAWFGLPFSMRYKNFILPEKINQSIDLYSSLVKHDSYILIHREIGTWEQPINIDLQSWRNNKEIDVLNNSQIIEINSSLADNMIFYVDLIKNAKEIHCTPSSFYCLVDSITKLTDAKLYYHNIRANTIMRVNNKYNNHRWEFINYINKV